MRGRGVFCLQRISGDLRGPCGEGPGSASRTLGDLEQGAREGALGATALRISFSSPFFFLLNRGHTVKKGGGMASQTKFTERRYSHWPH